MHHDRLAVGPGDVLGNAVPDGGGRVGPERSQWIRRWADACRKRRPGGAGLHLYQTSVLIKPQNAIQARCIESARAANCVAQVDCREWKSKSAEHLNLPSYEAGRFLVAASRRAIGT